MENHLEDQFDFVDLKHESDIDQLDYASHASDPVLSVDVISEKSDDSLNYLQSNGNKPEEDFNFNQLSASQLCKNAVFIKVEADFENGNSAEIHENYFLKTLKRKCKVPNQTLHCELCSFTSPWTGNLNAHKRKMHEFNPKIKCNFCEKEVVNIKAHIKTVHDKIRKKCDQCGLEVNNLKAHIEAVHEKKRRFQCEHCEFSCYQPNAMKLHIERRHTEVTRYTCTICFRKCLDLKLHFDKVHSSSPCREEENVFCPDCEYRTTTKANLRNHKKSVHDTRVVACEICEQIVRRCRIAKHMRTHSVKTYFCQPCNRGYRDRKDIARHILYSHQNQRCMCPYCGNDVKNLRDHVKWMHKDIPWKSVDISADLERMNTIKLFFTDHSVYRGELDLNKKEQSMEDFNPLIDSHLDSMDVHDPILIPDIKLEQSCDDT